MGEAISYALNQRAVLCCNTEQSYLNINNNPAERAPKQVTVFLKTRI